MEFKNVFKQSFAIQRKKFAIDFQLLYWMENMFIAIRKKLWQRRAEKNAEKTEIYSNLCQRHFMYGIELCLGTFVRQNAFTRTQLT